MASGWTSHLKARMPIKLNAASHIDKLASTILRLNRLAFLGLKED
jgi:hypothetical protein